MNNWIDWQKEDRYICLVQEPYIYKETTCNQPRTATRYAGGEGNSPRTAIYLSKNLDAWFIEDLSNRDATVVVIKINNRQTLIGSLYFDYTENVIQPWLHKIMDFVKHRGYALLLGIDSNCHSTLYGNETNPRGEKLEDFIASHKLTIENMGKTNT